MRCPCCARTIPSYANTCPYCRTALGASMPTQAMPAPPPPAPGWNPGYPASAAPGVMSRPAGASGSGRSATELEGWLKVVIVWGLMATALGSIIWALAARNGGFRPPTNGVSTPAVQAPPAAPVPTPRVPDPQSIAVRPEPVVSTPPMPSAPSMPSVPPAYVPPPVPMPGFADTHSRMEESRLRMEEQMRRNQERMEESQRRIREDNQRMMDESRRRMQETQERHRQMMDRMRPPGFPTPAPYGGPTFAPGGPPPSGAPAPFGSPQPGTGGFGPGAPG